MNTINRGWLLKQAKVGNLLAIASYDFTEGINDRQGGDRQENIEIPVRIISNGEDFKTGYCNLREWDFRSKSGCAYKNDDNDNIIHLIVHSNCNYEFKLKQ